MPTATLSVLGLVFSIAALPDPVRVELPGPAQAHSHDAWVQFYGAVARYIETREQLQPLDIEGLTADAIAIRRARETAIREARCEAGEGEVFGSPVAMWVRWHFERVLRRHPLDPVLLTALGSKTTTRVEPVGVNDTLPPGVAIRLSPALLENMPWLPKELEYRLSGRDLILWDADLDLIVDIVRDALPAPDLVSG